MWRAVPEVGFERRISKAHALLSRRNNGALCVRPRVSILMSKKSHRPRDNEEWIPETRHGTYWKKKCAAAGPLSAAPAACQHQSLRRRDRACFTEVSERENTQASTDRVSCQSCAVILSVAALTGSFHLVCDATGSTCQRRSLV